MADRFIRAVIVFIGAFLIAAASAAAESDSGAAASSFEVSNVFSDNMVLQQNEPIHIFGTSSDEGGTVWAELGDSIGHSVVENGEWCVELAPRCAGTEAFTLKVYGGEGVGHRVFENVLIGDVWLVIGQSNVEYSYGSMPPEQRAEAKMPEDGVRFIYFNSDDANKLTKDETKNPSLNWPATGRVWHKATHGENINASALGLCFAKELCELGSGAVPIGVISLGFGGRELAAFVPKDISKGMSGFDKKSDLYNAFIAPLNKFPARGVIWYQGEANAAYYEEYAAGLKDFIERFRSDKAQSTYAKIPFYIVELPPCFLPSGGEDPNWQYVDFGNVRGASGMIPSDAENCFICSTSDLWNDKAYKNSLHPPNKPAIAKRLANMAAASEWGFEGYEPSIAPTVKSIEQIDREGKAYNIFFDNVGEGLCFAGGKMLGFDAIGADWNGLKVKTELIKPDCVRITADEKIYRIRYAPNTDSVFGENATLCNTGGMPAASFLAVTDKVPVSFKDAVRIKAVLIIGKIYPFRYFIAAAVLLLAGAFVWFKFIRGKKRKDAGK